MTEAQTRRCVVLLPPNLYFVRLYEEIIAPAIAVAGMTSLLMEHSAAEPVSMDTIAGHVDAAGMLLADLSENTAEVWFAIGCAIASGRPLCLISSEPMVSYTLAPKQAHVITYPADAFPSDYIELQHKITRLLQASYPAETRISTPPHADVSSETAQPASSERFRSDVFSAPVRFAAPADDLVSYEILALTIIYLKSTEAGISPRVLGQEMQARDSAHLTSHAINALKRRRFIERRAGEFVDGVISDNIFITVLGEAWLIQHGKPAASHRPEAAARTKTLKHL